MSKQQSVIPAPVGPTSQSPAAARWTLDKTGGALVSAAVLGIGKFAAGLEWVTVILATSGVMVFAALFSLYLGQRRLGHRQQILEPLLHWQDLAKFTDLADYREKNSESEFMPQKIFERPLIKDLAVMGNGCGKWARSVSNDLARTKFRQIQAEKGKVRFLASCPIYLFGCESKEEKDKAVKNAKSLMILKEFHDDLRKLGGTFEIKLYKHLATLRLIIVDENECIVGHYQEDGVGESLDTPLLIFRGSEGGDWGFKHAFLRLFESEWHRARSPDEKEWARIQKIAKEAPAS